MNEKICKKCKNPFPIENFRPNFFKGYTSGTCKDCERKYHKERWRDKSPRIIHKTNPKPYSLILEEGTKWCSYCSLVKLIKEFYKCNQNKDGLRNACKPCFKKRKSTFPCEQPKAKRLANAYKRYGITSEEYNKRFYDQDGKCAICKREISLPKGGIYHPKKYHALVDHNHKTKQNRGILCHFCNIGLGSFMDDINNLTNAIKYLKDYQEKINV